MAKDAQFNAAQQGAFDALYGIGRASSQRDVMRIIGERIQAAVQISGLDGEEVAARIGHANGTQLSLWIAGERMPPVLPLIAISVVCSVSLDYLLGMTDEVERDPREAARRQAMAMMRQTIEDAVGKLVEVAREDSVTLHTAARAGAELAAAAHGLCALLDRAHMAGSLAQVPDFALILRHVGSVCARVGAIPPKMVHDKSIVRESDRMRLKYEKRS